jgi:hypothetical protein
MFDFERIAEAKIAEAIANGELDNLPGAGKPLALDDDSHIPPELRMAYRILKNADCLPPALQTRQEISHIEGLLTHIEDENRRRQVIKRLNLLFAKLDEQQAGLSLAVREQQYYYRAVDKWIDQEKQEK